VTSEGNNREPFFAGAEEDIQAASPPEPADYRDVIVVGASAGGVEALRHFVAALPPELPASLFVVLHVPATGTSVLPAILSRAGRLPATAAEDGERHERGHIYAAPPDRHMLLDDGRIRLTSGPRENGHRPAIDPLFRSASRAYGPRVIGVVLSGSLDDGAAGLRFVKDHGGLVLVQDPSEALYSAMPTNAIAATDPDLVAPAAEIARVVCDWLEVPLDFEQRQPEEEAAVDAVDAEAEEQVPALTCPECGGAMIEREEGNLIRFACRVGHTFSPDSLVTEQSKALEAALWSALRSLEERADLFRRLSRRYTGNARMLSRFEERAGAADKHAVVVREAVERLGDEPAETEPAA
jgi:two-component system, chemotaxis family, protein-glutamate methylesterase/glutaminase